MRLLPLLGIFLTSHELSSSEDSSNDSTTAEFPKIRQNKEVCEGNFRSLEDYNRIVSGIPVEPAHCVTERSTKPSHYRVVAGTPDYGGFFGRSGNEQIRWGEAVYVHPEYSHLDNKKFLAISPGFPPPDPRGTAYGDFSILEVEYSFEFGKYVAPAPLRRFQGMDWLDGLADSEEITCTVAGWGGTRPRNPGGGYPEPPFARDPGGAYSVTSLKTNQKLLPLAKCEQLFKKRSTILVNKFNRSVHICALAPCQDACQGDSGGPFFCYTEKNKHTLVGVVSFGFGCAGLDEPGVYARLDAAEPWIRAMIGDKLLENSVKRSVQAKCRHVLLVAVPMVLHSS